MSSPHRWPLRPRRGRVIAGVARGLSDRYRVHVGLLRGAFLLLSLAWGLGVALYVVGWLLLPHARARSPKRFRDIPRTNLRGFSREARATGRAHARRLRDLGRDDLAARRGVAFWLLLAGALTLLASFGAFAWLTPTRAVGLALLSVGAALLVSAPGLLENASGRREGRTS